MKVFLTSKFDRLIGINHGATEYSTLLLIFYS